MVYCNFVNVAVLPLLQCCHLVLFGPFLVPKFKPILSLVKGTLSCLIIFSHCGGVDGHFVLFKSSLYFFDNDCGTLLNFKILSHKLLFDYGFL